MDASDAAAPSAPAGSSASCAAQRTAVEHECGLAAEARAHAAETAASVRELRRRLAEAQGRVEQSEHDADRRMLSTAKAAAQRRYRAAVAADETPSAVAEATTAWMHEVDLLNRGARLAAATLGRARREVAAWQERLDHAMQVADVRRIAAESAAARCLDARRVLAACEEEAAIAERVAGRSAQPMDGAEPARSGSGGSAGPSPVASPGTTEPAGGPPDAATAPRMPAASTSRPPGGQTLATTRPGAPAVLRLLRGDRETLGRIADELAEALGREATTYQLALVELAEGIVSAAREQGAVHLPTEHPFWAQFDPQDAEALSSALAQMGYRSDGHGGWLGGRTPDPRELAIAVAHIGYDIRRLRRIPSAREMPALMAGASIAAEQFLASRAPDLMLDDMVDLLGARAERLSVLWDDWGRVRPVLLDRSD